MNKIMPEWPRKDAYEYFLMQKMNRYNFIRNLLSLYPRAEIKKKSFLSIGCGLAGEESWLVNQFKKVVLVDLDINQIKQANEYYERTKIEGDYEFCHCELNDNGMKPLSSPWASDNRLPPRLYNPTEKFDIIFTSSPQSWMETTNWDMPKQWIDFIQSYLKPDGLFLFRTYSGWAHERRGGERIFVDRFPEYIKKNSSELKVQGVWNITQQEYDKQNEETSFDIVWTAKIRGSQRKQFLLTEKSKGRHTQCFGIITKRNYHNFAKDTVSFYNYDKDNIFPLQFLKSWNIDNFQEVCQEQIAQLKRSGLRKKLLINNFI